MRFERGRAEECDSRAGTKVCTELLWRWVENKAISLFTGVVNLC